MALVGQTHIWTFADAGRSLYLQNSTALCKVSLVHWDLNLKIYIDRYASWIWTELQHWCSSQVYIRTEHCVLIAEYYRICWRTHDRFSCCRMQEKVLHLIMRPWVRCERYACHVPLLTPSASWRSRCSLRTADVQNPAARTNIWLTNIRSTDQHLFIKCWDTNVRPKNLLISQHLTFSGDQQIRGSREAGTVVTAKWQSTLAKRGKWHTGKPEPCLETVDGTWKHLSRWRTLRLSSSDTCASTCQVPAIPAIPFAGLVVAFYGIHSL